MIILTYRSAEALAALGPRLVIRFNLASTMTLRGIFFIGLLMFCAACGVGSSEPPTPGEMKDFASLCDKANEGKRVAVIGFLRFPEKFTGTSSVMLRLYAGGDYAGTPVGVQTRIGNQANQVELAPKEYTDKDPFGRSGF
jgi:hypothetical protein